MFQLNEKFEVNSWILKCQYNRNSPAEMSQINTANSQIYINIPPREDSVNSFSRSFLGLNFDVLHAAAGNRYVDGNDKS